MTPFARGRRAAAPQCGAALRHQHRRDTMTSTRPAPPRWPTSFASSRRSSRSCAPRSTRWRERFDAARDARHRLHQLGERGGAALHGARPRGLRGHRVRDAGRRIPSRAASTPPATAASSGRCASSPASARRARRTSATSSCSRTGRPGSRVAFDFPTLMGYDSDHPRSEGEVGKCGVAISSLADMETLFDGIPLDQVSTSMTINGPAIILFCFYVAAAEKQGVPLETAARARSRTTSSRSTWRSTPGASRSSRRCA